METHQPARSLISAGNTTAQVSADFRIPGLTLAIEPIINTGSREVETLDDHWTVVTKDCLPSGHFGHMVAITANGPIILTCGLNGEGWATAEKK